MNEPGEQTPSNPKKDIIRALTSDEYQVQNGQNIVATFTQIFEPERQLLLDHPELYILPPDATAILPSIDEETDGLIKKAWEKTLTEYQDKNRNIGFNTHLQDNVHTRVDCHTTMHDFVKNIWIARNMTINGTSVPIEIRRIGYSYIMIPDKELPDDLLVQLTQTLYSAFGVEHDEDPFTEASHIIQKKNARETLEAMILSDLISDPKTWTKSYQPSNMYVNPESRLCTNEEMEQWMIMCKKIIGKEIYVGEKGYMSYQIDTGQFQLGMDYPHLLQRPIDSSEKDLGMRAVEIPTPIFTPQQESPIGWLLCHIFQDNQGHKRVYFRHVSDDLYWHSKAQ